MARTSTNTSGRNPGREGAEGPTEHGRGPIGSLWKQYVLDRVYADEQASLASLQTRLSGESAAKLDAKILVILILVPLNLTMIHYWGLSDSHKWLPAVLELLGDPTPEQTWASIFRQGPYCRLYSLLYWVFCTGLGYFVVPALVIKFVFKESLSDYGLSVKKGLVRHLPVYAVLYLIVLPFVYMVSFSPSFLRTYPFYEHAGRSFFDFFAWELAYAYQFFTLEFFFRGFILHGLKHRFGAYAIVIMVVPYCMIHFGKPFPETVGAILAGTVLGALALWTRSIWLGFLIHVSVALTMDVLAVHRVTSLF
jgi:membrane protease YdiL (CAAX protease family)